MSSSSGEKAKQVLRWIAFLPTAFVSAWLGWMLINLLGRFGLAYAGVTAESFLGKVYFTTAGHLIMGAAFVYCGAKVAPSRQKVVAFVLAGLGIALSGFMLYPALIVADAWAFVGGICTAIGAGAVAYSVHIGETELE